MGSTVNKGTTTTADARMQWFRDAKFGMFIHWGLYAIPAGKWDGTYAPGAGEWLMNDRHIPVADYEKLAPQFNPTQFDAKEWVRIAIDAGMKYIVITTKHHDGFCLFKSKLTTYTVEHTPFGRDVMAELSTAAREAGLRIGWYHSIMDWHHPDAQRTFHPNYNDGKRKAPNFDRYYRDYLKPQVGELLTNYGQIDLMWFDGEWIADWNNEYGKDLYEHCRKLQPKIIVNNRVGPGRHGFEGTTAEGAFAGDYDTPEQQVPKEALKRPWESCITMNGTWGFRTDDTNWKLTQQLLKTLQEVNAKGGNLLLNVGPEANGKIPQASVDRLKEMGEHLRK